MSHFLDRPVFRLVGEVAGERGVRAFVIEDMCVTAFWGESAPT